MAEGEADARAGSPDQPRQERALARLYGAQTTPRERWALALAAAVAGLALATVHWSGLLVGGALVGLCWPTLRRALVAGLGFGVVVLGVAAVRFALAGTLGAVVEAWPLVAVLVLAPLVAGPLGAAVRGLFEDAPAGDDGAQR